MKRHTIITVLAVLLAYPALAQQGAVTVRIKDVTSYRLAGGNQLVGEGLVVGLAGTGDKDDEKAQEFAQALSDHASTISKNLDKEAFASSAIARVNVTATIDEGSTVAGATVVATVAALSDKTKSLEGGILISTSLKFGATGTVYADAFGLLTTSKRPGGGGGNNQGATTGTVSATLIDDIKIPFFEPRMSENGDEKRVMVLALDNPDINTANDIATKINGERESLGLGSDVNKKIARAVGIGAVEVEIPRKWWSEQMDGGSEMEFRYHIDNISINPDLAASVTINETSGVIVMSGNVRVLPCSITAAGVTITIGQNNEMPKKLNAGETATDPAVPVNTSDTTFQELLDALNLLNLAAGEKAEVLKALEASNHLQGKLKVVK